MNLKDFIVTFNVNFVSCCDTSVTLVGKIATDLMITVVHVFHFIIPHALQTF